MSFQSTRGFSNPTFSFFDVISAGLAPDGGLFIPENFPKIPENFIEILLPLSYPQRLAKVLSIFDIGISQNDLANMAQNAYQSFVHEKICPVVEINEKNAILELFWGPTASFKDMALQMTPHLFHAAQQSNNTKFCVLAATSGDTGIAAIEGFKNIPNVSVVVLFPKNGVSALQEKQMRSVSDKNVLVIAVESDFDVCQSTVKKIFADEAFTKKQSVQFTAANSMNWGRLLPQIGYYFSAYADLVEKKCIANGESIEVCVPSGNFGNLLAAYIAKEMGLPIKKFICASNENNVLTEFFTTGEYNLSEKPLIPSHSPSIDILISSNIERLLYLFNGKNAEEIKKWFAELSEKKSFSIDAPLLEKLQKEFTAGYCVHEQMQATIREFLQEYNYLLDPHTAVAVHVAKQTPQEHFRLTVATAHYQKFAPAMAQVFEWENENIAGIFSTLSDLGSSVLSHKNLDDLLQKPLVQNTVCSGEYSDITKTIEQFLQA